MTLQLHHTVAEFRDACERVRAGGGRLGLVPTMGALHVGHLALVDVAKGHRNSVALSIFVNPTQFGPNEDFARYPRTLEHDLSLCAERGVDHVFAPSVAEMYPPGEKTRVSVAGLVDVLCGPKRPGHFEGVATIVSKLFHVAGPCLAVFGRKDYQQLQVIRRMVTDLLMPIEVLGHATVRESDGLALSSRNAFLTQEERSSAPVIARELGRALGAFERGERRAGELRRPVEAAILRAGLRVDYVEFTTAETLEPISDSERLPERALLAVAAFAGKTRLIDNLVFGEDSAPLAEAGA